MKRFLLLSLVATVALAASSDTPMLVKAGKVITQPSLKEPLGKEWSQGKGKWTAENGVLTAVEVPEEKHVPVLHLATGPTPLVWECEFRMSKESKSFLIGCDGTRHIGRLVVTPKKAHLSDDSTEVKGKSAGTVLAEAGLDIKPGEWQHVRVEATGDQMAARVGEAELRGQNPNLATPKVRWWFAVGGPGVEIRNIKVSEGVPVK
jgi:hypothetical protein